MSAAVRQFTIRTLVRSRQHRTLLALYMGLGLAVVISTILPLALQRGVAAFARPGVAVLAAPLVMMFVALVGMRVAFAIPVDIKANWVIRLGAGGHERRDGRRLLGAAGVGRRAVRRVGRSERGRALGVGVARLHVLVTSLLGWLLAELLVLRLCKVPFTCTYLPGRSEVKTMWPIYFTAFTTFSFSMAGLELQMLRRPLVLIAFIVIVTGGAIATRVLRRLWLASDPALRFVEEEHGALFEGFHLERGLAATAKTDPGARGPR